MVAADEAIFQSLEKLKQQISNDWKNLNAAGNPP
jgi:FAD synthase